MQNAKRVQLHANASRRDARRGNARFARAAAAKIKARSHVAARPFRFPTAFVSEARLMDVTRTRCAFTCPYGDSPRAIKD